MKTLLTFLVCIFLLTTAQAQETEATLGGEGTTEIDATLAGNSASDGFSVKEGANTLFRVRGDGNVGIGTASPSQKLTVDGALGILEGGASATNYTIFRGAVQATDITYTLPSTDGNVNQFLQTNGTGVLTWTSSVNSETDPTLIDDASVIIGNSSGNTTLTFNSDAGTDGTITWDGINDQLEILNGNVGIGTTSPSSKLEVSGSIETGGLLDQNASNFFDGGCGDNQHVTGISSSGTINCGSNTGDISGVAAGFGLNGGGTTGALTLSLDLVSANSWSSTQTFNANTNFPGSGIWNTTGNVGIGTTSPGNILTIQQTSSTDPIADAWTIYSSRRWKENIKPLEGALDKVMQLQGVSYDLKADGKHDIGLIAEEVGEVIPEVVVYEENGIDAQSVDYARLVSVLIEAVKDQQKQIEELERRISSLSLKEIDRTSYGYTKTNMNK